MASIEAPTVWDLGILPRGSRPGTGHSGALLRQGLPVCFSRVAKVSCGTCLHPYIQERHSRIEQVYNVTSVENKTTD